MNLTLTFTALLTLVSLLLAKQSEAGWSYPFPIKHQARQFYQQQHIAPLFRPEPVSSRRVDHEDGLRPDGREESEELRQLHQVVDTMAQLLSEEEQINKELQGGQLQQPASKPQLAHEMLSESDIRFALEELERVQMRERKSSPGNAESKLGQSSERIPAPEALTSSNKHSFYESLIDEVAGEFPAREQQADSARNPPKASEAKSSSPDKQASSTSATVGQASSSSASPPPTTPASNNKQEVKSALMTGQLESLGAGGDLSAALSNDFYNLQGEGASGSHGELGSDLDQAAQQNRNSVVQQNGNLFNQPFNQPAPEHFVNLAAPAGSQQNLVRVFREQSNQPFNDQAFGGIPTSSSQSHLQQPADNFWRPTNSNPALPNQAEQQPPPAFNNEELSQQFNRAANLALPAPRFQSIPPAEPFVPNAANNNHRQVSTSTGAPMISVLGGREPLPGGLGNSVSWNPPPNGNFKQHFSPSQLASSTQAPRAARDNLQFFQAPNSNSFQGPPSGFVGIDGPNFAADNFRSQFQNNNFQSSSTEANFRSEPETSSQWSQPAAVVTTTSATLTSSSPVVEREAADSRPRSSVRSNERASEQAASNFFPSSEFLASSGPSTRQATPTPPVAVPTTTPASAGNSTKKEDMVIYYYYYYDDNKNATVVAKNVTAPGSSTAAPSSLEAAIEADGGVEDTPYMDDPAPALRPLAPLTTTTTTTPTTGFHSATPTSFRAPELPGSQSASQKPPSARFQAAPSRAFTNPTEPSTVFSSTKPSHFEQPRGQSFPDTSELSSPRVPAARQQQAARQPPVASFTPTPKSQQVPSSASGRLRAQHPDHSEGPQTSSNRFPSSSTTESSHQHNSFTAQPARAALPSRQSQTDLIQNVLNGVGPAASGARRPAQPQALGGSNNARVPPTPLSNASRYGTSNNLLLDPYVGPALEPVVRNLAAPGSAPEHQHWGAPNLAARPRPLPEAGLPGEPVRRPPVAEQVEGNSEQQFSSQRTPLAGQLQPASSPRAPSSRQQTPAKQFFPEQPASVERAPSSQFRSQATGVPPKQAAHSEELNRSPPGNGRPSSAEGNTGNGFTRSPSLLQSSPVTQAPPAELPATVERRLPQTTQSSVSTSVSSVSSSSSTSSPPAASGTSQASSSEPSQATNQPGTSTTSSSATSAASQAPLTTTQAAPSNSPSSAEESGAASSSLAEARNKKFGNRNNRFQTRLNSNRVASSTTTTTSTTPAPGSSTSTRRPLSSTTRKSSRQLFVGGRRPGRLSAGNANEPAGSNSSAVVISTSTAFSVTESSSSSSAPARLKFGNTFNGRSKATSAPAAEAPSSTQRPSNLFGGQARPSFRPKLANGRVSKPVVESASSPTESAPERQLPAAASAPSEETFAEGAESNSTTTPAALEPAEEATELKREEEAQPAASSTTTTTTTTTTTPAPSVETSGRNKPKVRPLFASRQRNNSLFGNRQRNNSTAI